MVSLGAFQYIKAKGAIKDIGRVLDIPFTVTNKMTSEFENETIQEVLELGLLDKYKKDYPELFEYVERLAGLPKSFSVHPCGKVISTNNTIYYNATDINDKGEIILQGDMHTADDLGLIKADFLGLRTVDVIYDTLEMIGKDYEYIAPYNLDFHDSKVFENFRNGLTSNIFQFESNGMRDTLKKIECNSVNDLTVANALFRPGSIKYIDNYANRRKGTETYKYLHPDLEPILKNTYGIIVFQEQLIEIGRLAKLSNPDELRKATAKKKAALLDKIKPELYNGLMKRGWTTEQLDSLWESMLDFAKYSFNKCVAGSTTLIKPANRKSVRNPSVKEMYLITHDLQYAKDNNYLPLRSKYLRLKNYGTALSMFDDGKIRKNIIEDIQPSGIRKLYRVTTETGKWIECTDNHKFPTTNGIKQLSEINVGDYLYILGSYNKRQYNYNFTDGNFESNIPVAGQMGFQKRPNGESVKFESYREYCRINKIPCSVCGKEYKNNSRFELHHIDKNRHNNEQSNLQWCCVSCHKKLDYKLGRTKTYENGIDAIPDKIVSIEYVREEMTYDVTMADPAHNFIANNGLVTCNSHAAAYAIIAYICMYLKTHHPKEFVCACINSVSNKAEKIAECISEANRLGIKIYLGKYNNCSPKTIVYKDGIMIGTNTIKGCNSEIAEELMKIGKKDSFIELLDCVSECKINTAQLKSLVVLNYFSDFGKISKMLFFLDIYNGVKENSKTILPSFRTCSQIKKDKIDLYEQYGITDYLVQKYSKKETAKLYKEIDNIGLLNEVFNKFPNQDLLVADLVKNEIECLQYTTYCDSSIGDNLYIVVEYKTFKDETKPSLVLHNLNDGTEIKTRIKQSAVYKQNPFGLYSILQVENFADEAKKKLVDGKWIASSEIEKILKEYKCIRRTELKV